MKKQLTFLVFLLFCSGLLFSQEASIDSLKHRFKIISGDTTRLHLLKEISGLYFAGQPDSSLYYAQKMLVLAQKTQHFYEASDACELMSNVYEQQGALDKCIVLQDSAKQFSEIIADTAGIIYFTNNKAGIYIKWGRYFDALQTFKEAKRMAVKAHRPAGEAAALNNIGVVYHYLGDDKTSLDYFIKAYEIRVTNKLTKKLAYSLNNIGAIYSKYGNYTEALNYHKKAMHAADSLSDPYNYMVALINVGLDYDFLKNYKLSLDYYNKALQEAVKQGDKTLQSHALERMSAVYAKINNHQKAKTLLEKAYETAVTINNKYDIASFANSLGMIYLKEKNYSRAYTLFSRALEVSKKIKAGPVEADVYKSLAAYFYSTGNSDRAFAYQKLYDTKRDSIYKEESELKIANLKNRFELDLKKEELTLKNFELTSAKKLSSERLKIIYVVAFAGAVMLILLLYIILLYGKIKRKNQIIRQSEAKVKELLQKEKELGKLKTRLISTVSHEFRTPLAIISSNAQLLRNFEKSMDDKMKSETLKYIQNGVDNIIGMMKNFEVLDSKTILEFKPENINLSKVLHDIVNELQSLQPFKNRITIRDDISDEYFVTADKTLITHIVRNLLTNALKFSGNKNVDFYFQVKSKSIYLTVTDKGIGMSKIDVEKIFEDFHRGANVANIKGTGVGMSVVKRCVDLHGGEIFIASTPGTGTKITIVLPFKNSKNHG